MKDTGNGFAARRDRPEQTISDVIIRRRSIWTSFRRERPAPDWQDPDTVVLQQRGRGARGLHIWTRSQGGACRRGPSRRQVTRCRSLKLWPRCRAVRTRSRRRGTVRVLVWSCGHFCAARRRRAGRLAIGHTKCMDCKLAAQHQSRTILQLYLYSDLLGAAQGIAASEYACCVPGEGSRQNPIASLIMGTYYRFVRAQLESCVAQPGGTLGTYPEGSSARCDVCRWWQECDRTRRRDDHLKPRRRYDPTSTEAALANGTPQPSLASQHSPCQSSNAQCTAHGNPMSAFESRHASRSWGATNNDPVHELSTGT